jgi:hypothetical protein
MPHFERYREGLVPLSIGVTGHRDLVDGERAAIRRRVVELFEKLQSKFPDRPLRILSPLAEGADRLVAEVALEMNLELAVVLPMPVNVYRKDFTNPESLEEFERLMGAADEVLLLPFTKGATIANVAVDYEHRKRQYAQLGVFLCAHAHILLALWDGKPTYDVGGTAQVIRFHHYDVMEGYTSGDKVSQMILADDDSDLVYHIVVSRDREDGAPVCGLKPLDVSWLTTDEETPRTPEIPSKYSEIFERTSAFNRDARKHADDIVKGCYPLIDASSTVRLPTSVLRINTLFCAADYLAIHFQRRFVWALRASHAFIFLMALMFLFYSDFEANRVFMLVFAICFVLAYFVNSFATKWRWHEKYLEYRTLAEGLRVQFYWAAAGVTSGNVTKYTHDNFLQKQDIELGWIRNVMRVAGVACDVAPNKDPAGLAFVIEEWIGDESTSGQLSYYRAKASQYLGRSKNIETVGKVVGLVVIAALIGSVIAPTESMRSVMFILLGLVLLTIGVRDSFQFRVAEKEVIKQYEFMYRIFSNAGKRVARADNDRDRRKILRVLGEAALDEHAEWILLHRERPLSQSELWRMEG